VDFHKEKRSKYGDVFKTHILGRPTIRVTGAENVRKILMKEEYYVTSQWPQSVRSILGAGTLAMATGELHRTRRRNVMRAFNFKALCDYVPSIQNMVHHYLTTWSERDVILAYPELKRMMFSVACETLLGFNMDTDQEGQMLTIFENITSNIFSLPIYLPGTGFYKVSIKRRLQHLSFLHKVFYWTCYNRNITIIPQTIASYF
jgi:cytochrome P450